jgi:hypothetical protein
MTNTYTISKIDHIIEIGTTLTKSWFRGNSKIFNELTPGIFRKKFDNQIYRALRPYAEFSIIESFKRKAPSLTSNLPDIDDHVSWLFLMQHHGLPTRLLDWTKNALVGLYFAINKDPSEDGELWALFPEALNNHNGFFGLPVPNCKTLKYIAAEPSHNNPEKLVDELKLKQRPKYPLAVDPPLHFPRMVSQLSTFTIHPRPEEGCNIPDVMTDENHLVKYIIPGRCKKQLLLDLAALGITKVTLFPDLDLLSSDIIQEHNVVAYSPPKPPRWENVEGNI